MIYQAGDNIAFAIVPGVELNLRYLAKIKWHVIGRGPAGFTLLDPRGIAISLTAGKVPYAPAQVLHEEGLAGTPLAEYTDGQGRVSTRGSNQQRQRFHGSINAQQVLLGVN